MIKIILISFVFIFVIIGVLISVLVVIGLLRFEDVYLCVYVVGKVLILGVMLLLFGMFLYFIVI